ncbi:MAG: alanine racemase [Dethiobacter sp.]|jgi:alanine racemase|nr:alanine racemase [Dethiobacter sp.]
MNGLEPARPTWAEIDLNCIAHNVAQFRRHLGLQTQIMAVVKADAYGHGAVETARAALEAGASQLAVALPEEGVQLRQAGIAAPVLVFGYSDPNVLPLLQEYCLTPSILDLDTAKAYSERLLGRGEQLPVHIEVDTGMGRVGLSSVEAVDLIAAAAEMPGLKLEGLFTHFAAADEAGRDFTDHQLRSFNRMLEHCRRRGLPIPLRHAANSAAAIAYPEARYDMIRLGISLYGCYPSSCLQGAAVSLRPALSLKSRIVFLKEVPPGTPIGYGYTYRAATQALIATVPIGYADGYSRRFSNNARVLVRGEFAPVVGRVSMDQITIDVTGVSGVTRGDEVVIYGRQGNHQITVAEAAEAIGTISYELLCAVGKRVPRFYLRTEREG